MEHIKIAKTAHPVADFIKNRWSARSFSTKAITENELNTMLEAGTWAFSGNNEQPWRVIPALRGTETYNKILATLMEGNTPWAKNAAAFVLTIAKTNFDKEGNPFNGAAEHDLGAFNTTLVLQALTMGIYAHPMGGFYRDKVKETFNLSENLKPMVILALGYLDEADKLEEPFKSRELTARSRKSVEEITLKG